MSKKCGSEEISDVKFSPDGKRVAIGSHNNYIYVYDFGEPKELMDGG